MICPVKNVGKDKLDGRGKGRVISFSLHPHLTSPIKGEELFV